MKVKLLELLEILKLGKKQALPIFMILQIETIILHLNLTKKANQLKIHKLKVAAIRAQGISTKLFQTQAVTKILIR